MVIIGLIGKKGSGKTTVANYLQKKLGYHEIAFADALKETIQIWYPDLDQKVLHDPMLKEVPVDALNGSTPRSIMQKIGTDLVREHYDDELWLNIVKKKISMLKPNDNIVVSDIRFQNELDTITEYNMSEKVIIFRIIRTNLEKVDDKHITENQELSSSFIVNLYNDGTIEELFEKIEKKLY